MNTPSRHPAIPSLRHSHSGSMMMEFLLVMPLLFVLIMGVVQLAHIWTARMVTHYAAFCAARATLTTNEKLSLLALGKVGPVYEAAQRVCAWAVFSDNGEWEGEVAGWGKIPHSAELEQRVRVVPRIGPMPLGGRTVGAPWLAGATVEFDFPLLIPVAGTMLGWLGYPSRTEAELDASDYRPVSGWTGEKEHGDYGRPYLTLTETVWLPKPYSTERYPYPGQDVLKLLTK